MSTKRRIERLEDTLALYASDSAPNLLFIQRDDGPIMGSESNPVQYRGEISPSRMETLEKLWPADKLQYIKIEYYEVSP